VYKNSVFFSCCIYHLSTFLLLSEENSIVFLNVMGGIVTVQFVMIRPM
jgi:hypothetical protein